MVSHQIAQGQGHHEAEHDEAHASDQTYIRIAIILAIITIIEVFIYYLPSFRPLLVPVLIVLSVAKFATVVGYFMHLKYDRQIFRIMFIAGLVLSLGVFLAMLAMFFTVNTYQPLIGG